jgi:hypothetical protein
MCINTFICYIFTYTYIHTCTCIHIYILVLVQIEHWYANVKSVLSLVVYYEKHFTGPQQ